MMFIGESVHRELSLRERLLDESATVVDSPLLLIPNHDLTTPSRIRGFCTTYCWMVMFYCTYLCDCFHICLEIFSSFFKGFILINFDFLRVITVRRFLIGLYSFLTLRIGLFLLVSAQG
jgi:hypothetical protein